MTLSRLLRTLLGRGASSSAGAPPVGDPARIDEVESALSELRPMLRADGGDVELVRIEGGRVELRFRGACSSCSAHVLTFNGAVRPRLMERCSWIEEVRSHP